MGSKAVGRKCRSSGKAEGLSGCYLPGPWGLCQPQPDSQSAGQSVEQCCRLDQGRHAHWCLLLLLPLQLLKLCNNLRQLHIVPMQTHHKSV